MCALRFGRLGETMTANREGVASDTARPRSAAGVIVLAIVIAAIALGAAGYGASRWMESRVERQVDAAFASMRTTLGVATYGHQEFHPLSRSMAIDDVVLQPRNGATPAIKIRQLVLSGLPIFPTDSFAAGASSSPTWQSIPAPVAAHI